MTAQHTRRYHIQIVGNHHVHCCSIWTDAENAGPKKGPDISSAKFKTKLWRTKCLGRKMQDVKTENRKVREPSGRTRQRGIWCSTISTVARQFPFFCESSVYPALYSACSALRLLVGRQEEHPACKNWVVRCWRIYLSGVRYKWFA